MKVKTNIKAGLWDTKNDKLIAHELAHVVQQGMNHNQTMARGLKVKTNVKAGLNPQPEPPGRQ